MGMPIFSRRKAAKIAAPALGRCQRGSRDGTLPAVSTITFTRLDHARQLDRQADAALFCGYHAAAERLAHQAAELRGAMA